MNTYGLRLTNNSKTGPAFSMPRMQTCINKTHTCFRVCYGNGIRYQSEGQRQKRQQNYRTAEFLLKHGGPEPLAENLVSLIDQAKPADWLTSTITGRPTDTPWTVRVHDLGDYPEFRTIPTKKGLSG